MTLESITNLNPCSLKCISKAHWFNYSLVPSGSAPCRLEWRPLPVKQTHCPWDSPAAAVSLAPAGGPPAHKHAAPAAPAAPALLPSPPFLSPQWPWGRGVFSNSKCKPNRAVEANWSGLGSHIVPWSLSRNPLSHISNQANLFLKLA